MDDYSSRKGNTSSQKKIKNKTESRHKNTGEYSQHSNTVTEDVSFKMSVGKDP